MGSGLDLYAIGFSMARPLRIEYRGAWYDVMNRVAGRGLVFKTLRVLLQSLLIAGVVLLCPQAHGGGKGVRS